MNYNPLQSLPPRPYHHPEWNNPRGRRWGRGMRDLLLSNYGSKLVEWHCKQQERGGGFSTRQNLGLVSGIPRDPKFRFGISPFWMVPGRYLTTVDAWWQHGWYGFDGFRRYFKFRQEHPSSNPKGWNNASFDLVAIFFWNCSWLILYMIFLGPVHAIFRLANKISILHVTGIGFKTFDRPDCVSFWWFPPFFYTNSSSSSVTYSQLLHSNISTNSIYRKNLVLWTRGLFFCCHHNSPMRGFWVDQTFFLASHLYKNQGMVAGAETLYVSFASFHLKNGREEYKNQISTLLPLPLVLIFPPRRMYHSQECKLNTCNSFLIPLSFVILENCDFKDKWL